MPKLRLVDSYSFRDILEAYLDCRRRKRNTRTALAFDIDYAKNLQELLEEINAGAYRIGPSRGFVVTYPKPREVWAAQFRDRIVHHLVYRDIAPFYISRFISANCACIKGRGTLYASRYLEKYCRSITQNWQKPAWFLQLDIANFFVSIRRDLLWSIMARDMGEASLTSRLVKMIIFHDPTEDAIVKPGTNFNLVPRHKSLWHAPKGCGLPIGDLPSQLCASGIYLDGLDKFVKHELKCRCYVRYVDDAVLLADSPEMLTEWRDRIDQWLMEERSLRLARNKTVIRSVNAGINFVGRVILPFRTYIRRSTVAQAKNAVASLRANPLDARALASVNSYLGLMRHCNSYNLRKKTCEDAALPLFVEADDEFTKVYHI